MGDKDTLTSDAFHVFMKESPKHAHAWMNAVQTLGTATALDQKTLSLAYLAVLAALRLVDGVPVHVAIAKEAGASREEIVRAILVGLPAAGNAVIHALPAATRAYDQK